MCGQRTGYVLEFLPNFILFLSFLLFSPERLNLLINEEEKKGITIERFLRKN